MSNISVWRDKRKLEVYYVDYCFIVEESGEKYSDDLSPKPINKNFQAFIIDMRCNIFIFHAVQSVPAIPNAAQMPRVRNDVS